MSVEFARMQQIFLSAVEQHRPEDWDAYLEQACAGDDELRDQVKLLLKAHVEAGSVVSDQDPTNAYQSVAETPGTVIGPYKLLEQIGEGGMGDVWMAEQSEPIQRRVAVKVIKAGMDSKQVLARFDAERQALALMDHPNIAKVLDAGATTTGRPYFVMELVKGTPITRFCDEKKLNVRERLELFGDVCRAVQHAHQKGIIHRDIKPSNVLVAPYDGKPVVKVIDFGVAKATGQKLTDATLFTGFGAVVGTPEYMSPEQAEVNNQDIDTRSDIYSLGVLLFELLTGSTPLTRKRVKDAAFLEVLRVIREEESPKPSTRLSSTEELPSISAQRHTEPAKLTKLVRGELDWIVMKALEKDPSRRYETANAFAMDVQRYLADEAVQACPPSTAYRLRMFVRRNKSGLAVASLVLLFLVIIGSGVGWTWRDRATRQANVAGQVESILADVDRLEGEQKWSEALAAVRRAEAVVTGGAADAVTADRVRQRLKDLELLHRLDQVRMMRATSREGAFDFAGVDREYARAFRDYGLDVLELPVHASIDRLKARPALAVPLAAALDDWVHTRRRLFPKDAAGWKGLVAVARGIDPEPLRDRLRSTWGQPVSKELQDELHRLAQSIDVPAHPPATLLSVAYTLQRVNHLEAGVRLLRDAQYVYPGDFWLNFELALALDDRNDHEGAIRFYSAAIAIRPASTAAHNNLARPLRSLKRMDEAIAVYRKAIELDPKFTMAHYNLGAVLCGELGDHEKAIESFRKAIELDTNYALAYSGLGNALAGQKKLGDAIAAFTKAIEINPKFALAYRNLGVALGEQNKLDEAIAALEKANTLDSQYAHAYASAYNDLGIALHDQEKLDDAIAAYRKAIVIDPHFAMPYSNLGNALCDQDKLPEAIDAYRMAVEVDPNYAKAYFHLGEALSAQMKLPEAIDAYKKASTLDQKYIRVYAESYIHLGNALRDQKKLNEAIDAYSQAIKTDPQLALAYHNLGAVLHEQKKWDEAVKAFRKATELDSKSGLYFRNLGIALRDQKNLGEAIDCFKKAIEVDPEDAKTYGNLGAALASQKKWREAGDALRRQVELDLTNANAYCNLGVALTNQGKLDEAIAAYRKALEVDPKLATARQGLSNALWQEGWGQMCSPDPKRRDPKRAVETVKEAIELVPQSDMAWQCLGWVHYRLGEWRASIETLEQSCKLQEGGKGDAGQWIVLALAHARLAAQYGLPEKEREHHKAEARRRYEEADKQIDRWWRVRPGHETGQAIWDFRAEARELLSAKESKK